MENIAICIPTYKRPDLLKKTLDSIYNNDLSNSKIGKVDIIVVDNDLDRTGEITVNGFMNVAKGEFRVNYYNYAKKGLANVRNKLLEQAISLKPTYIVFIDDDEYASPTWLKELVDSAHRHNADIAAGPVHSVFEKPVPKYLSYWFKKPELQEEKPIRTIASNNLIIRTAFLINSKLRFDQRFNTTGAEDTYFGIQAMQKGAKIFWAANAVVYETVLENRINLNWLVKRRYRGAITFTFILLLEKQYLQLGKKAITSLVYLLFGMLGLSLLPFNGKNKYWGVLKIAEGWGGLAGLFNIKYHEYK